MGICRSWKCVCLALAIFWPSADTRAIPVEMVIDVSEDASEQNYTFGATDPENDPGRSIFAILPHLMPLFASTSFDGYHDQHHLIAPEDRAEWSAFNGHWLKAMLPTLLAVRDQAAIKQALIYQRRKEREERERVAPRAGQPTVRDEEDDAQPRLGVKLTDVLLRYSNDLRAEIVLQMTDTDYVELNPLEPVAEGSGLLSSALGAEIDAATADRLGSSLESDDGERSIGARAIDLAGRGALKMRLWEDQLTATLPAGMQTQTNLRGSTHRNLINPGAGHVGNGRSQKSQSTRNVSLTSFIVNVMLSVATSPTTYLVAVPVGFGWILLRVARTRRT